MKKIFLLLIINGLALIFPSTIFAQSLEVDLGVSSGQPIFVIENMLPGDTETRTVTITNPEDFPIPTQVRGEYVEGSDDAPLLEAILEMTVTENSAILYQGNLADFLNEDFIYLSTIPAEDTVTLTFSVYFPEESGNEYQEKFVIFDLIFSEDIETQPHIVINEVYYQLNENGDSCTNGGINANISNNGRGSTNIININASNRCLIVQNNSANVNNGININVNTGNNSSGLGSIFTGDASINISVFNRLNINFGSCGCSGGNEESEWVEIYNPTNETVNLRRWYLGDDEGEEVDLKGRLMPGQFAIVADRKVLRDLDIPSGTRKVRNNNLDSILDDEGDHLILYNRDDEEIDAVGWGDDTFIWNPAVPLASDGNSIGRINPGIDTDQPSDWQDQPPNPGL